MQPIKHANLDLFEHDNDEEILGEVPRHPIGIVFIFINAFIVLTVLLGGLFLVIRYQTNAAEAIGLSDAVDVSNWATALVVLLAVLIMIGSFIAYIVYLGNYLVLTSEKLVLVFTKNIFARKVSQLAIGDVQDVTVDQPGFLSRMFHYGTINIETSGEQANFSFHFTPNPHEAAKAIVEAHEKNMKLYGN